MARLVLAVWLAVACGCAAITRVPLQPRAPDRRDDGLETLIGAVHVHSFRSHDCQGADQDIEAAARLASLDFVLFTDHRRSATGRDEPGREWQSDRTLFLPGYEVNYADGSLLVMATPPKFDPHGDPSEVIDRVVRGQSLLGLGHLEEVENASLRVDVTEIFNLHAAARDAGVVGMIFTALFLPAACLMDHLTELDARTVAAADRRTLPRSVVFGCDAHANIRILWGLLGTIGSYDDVFRSVTTHVLARDRSKAALLEALRLGHCYGVFARQGDAQGFEFYAQRGQERVLMGGELDGAAVAPATMTARLPLAGEMLLLRDGMVVARTVGRELECVVTEPGRYRIQAQRDGLPWIVSSAIDLVQAKPAQEP